MNGMKNANMQVTYFLNSPTISLFYCHISHSLTLEAQIGKIQCFNVTDGIIKMLKCRRIPKISIKMKNVKTFYKVQTVSRLKKIIQVPHQVKDPYVSETKNFSRRYTGTYIHFLSKSRIQFLGV